MKKDTIWVGLDVHAKSIAVAILALGMKEPQTRSIPNKAEAIGALFAELLRKAVVFACYEAGPCGYAIHRQLRSMGVSCEVIAPSLIPSKPGERIKTDRRDAVKLARYLRAGELTPIVVPDEQHEADRDLMRVREDVRRDRTAARNRLSKFLLRQGLHIGGNKREWTKGHWEWVRAQRLEHPSAQFTFEHYIAEVERLDLAMARVEAAMNALAATPRYAGAVGRLTCLRGIKTLSAMVLLTELGDLRRFDHPRQLMAYTGLVASERSSGESTKRGGITKTGNAHVRRILVEAAWSYRHGRTTLTPRVRAQLETQPSDVATIATKSVQRLSKRYARLVARGKPSPVASTAVARELCGFVWSLGRNPELTAH